LDLRGLFASIVRENLFLIEGAVQRELGKIILVTINLFFIAQVCLLTRFCMQIRHACSFSAPALWYDRSFLQVVSVIWKGFGVRLIPFHLRVTTPLQLELSLLLEDINGCLFWPEQVKRVRVWLSPIFLLLFECLVRNMRGRLHIAIYLPPLNRRLGLIIDL